jgi:hypothetical protein
LPPNGLRRDLGNGTALIDESQTRVPNLHRHSEQALSRGDPKRPMLITSKVCSTTWAMQPTGWSREKFCRKIA